VGDTLRLPPSSQGGEHSIANMYCVPLGLRLHGHAQVVRTAGQSLESLTNLTWMRFLVNHLLPVTLGKLCGGTLMVGGVHTVVYLRREAFGGQGNV
jgi:formate transporter